MKKKILAVTLVLALCLGMVGCRKSYIVNYNLSKSGDEFNLYRRITVTNARTDTIMLQAEGYMSLSNNNDNELVVTIKTGSNTYCKDYIYLNDWTCYVMEQIEPTGTDEYHYELIFYPEHIVPEVEIK